MLAEVIDPRYQALVLLGTFGSLRWGELAGLRRKDIDLASCTIRVERQLTEMPGGGYAYGPPKSEASVRTVSIPNLVVPRIRWHLAQFSKEDPGAPVFTAPRARRCGTATSGAASGSPRSRRLACQPFTFTT